MFHLKCFIDGELHQEIKINPGQEIIIGRDDAATVKLDSYPGISRQHIKLVHLGDKLLVERMSQAGKLVVNGLSERSIEISGQGQFSIPPYNFEVLQEVEDVPYEAVSETAKDEDEQEEFFSQDSTYAGDFEKTSISNSQELVASFKRLEFGNIVDEFKMNDSKWTFGRGKTCHVFIDHDKASRQHFEVYKLNNKFYIKDLGSSNGTFLNGHQLPANNEVDLKSGDIISIQDYKLVFEIKDSFVEKQIYSLPDNYKPVDLGHLAHNNSGNNVGVQKVKEGIFNPANLTQQKKIRMALAGVVLAGLAVFALLPPPNSGNSQKQRDIAAARQLEEENKVIENAKIAAIQYIGEARWSLCLSEVQRIQEIRPDDQDAAEIGVKCQTALEALERQSQIEAQERDRLAIIEKVNGIIAQCRPRVNEGSAAIRECLQDALELSPENEEIAKLFDEAESIDREKEEKKAKHEKYLQRLNAGLGTLKKADDFKERQFWEEAIKWYKVFIKGKYPDPKNNKARAQREIASIQSALESTLKKALEDAKLEFGKENYRDAVIAARGGLAIDEYHADLKKIESESLGLLRVEIRSLYQDSILMEDLGKIHTAISKWKQIIERDVPGEEYFLKAEGKLKNYETEI